MMVRVPTVPVTVTQYGVTQLVCGMMKTIRADPKIQARVIFSGMFSIGGLIIARGSVVQQEKSGKSLYEKSRASISSVAQLFLVQCGVSKLL
jgi:hypothetical protein